MNSPNSPRRKPQPLPMCWISECALYCVSTEIWRMPELRQFEHEIDDPELATERRRGLAAVLGQLLEALAAPAGHDHGQRATREAAQVPPRGEHACCSVDIRLTPRRRGPDVT